MISFGDRLDKFRGFGPGFDFCRIALAASVIAWHSLGVTHGMVDLDARPMLWLLEFSVLPMFFGLSGFLIAGSAQRLSLRNFLLNRGLRIMPALTVEIVFAAFVLGPLLTILPLRDYFSGRDFALYPFNIVGVINYHLPGVFLRNPLPRLVNFSLWTVPIELLCYAIISILVVTRKVADTRFIVGLAVVYILAWTLFVYLAHPVHVWLADYILQSVLFNKEGVGLIPAFLLGIAAYNARSSIPWSRTLAAGAIIILLAIGFTGQRSWILYPAVNAAIVPLLVYLVVFIGLSKVPKIPLYSTGDYSYGVYLYGFPLQQTLIQLLPGLHYPLHFILSFISASLFAAFSWHCIEKPILGLRKNFAFVSRQVDASHGV